MNGFFYFGVDTRGFKVYFLVSIRRYSLGGSFIMRRSRGVGDWGEER